jgi:hypothetical protein
MAADERTPDAVDTEYTLALAAHFPCRCTDRDEGMCLVVRTLHADWVRDYLAAAGRAAGLR